MKKYKKIKFPVTRIATQDVGRISGQRHFIPALLEFDVTDIRNSIKNLRKIKTKHLSFTAWLIKTISITLEEFPAAHSFLKNKRKAVSFDDIDISITVEREYQGELVPLPYVIRQTNKKDFFEITNEILNAKNQNVSSDNVILGEKKHNFGIKLYYMLPGFLRRAIMRFMLGRPSSAQKMMGSVVITSVGMMGKVNGWFIQTSMHPISFGIGSIISKPGAVNGRIEIREFLNMTVLIDHDVMDGAPMARFISKLSQNIESGLGLQPAEKQTS